MVPWHFVIAGFHQNPANKLRLAGNEQLRQAGFQFDLLNAPTFLWPRHLKTTANRLLILPATQTYVTRHAGLETEKILRLPCGKQLEKYSHQMQIFSLQFL